MEVTFESLGLSEAMLKALEEKGYGYPTTIQAEAIPYFLQWRDVIAKAPTGTGKTFAFGIPMIEHIDPANEGVQGLILAPTRELAIQIGDELRGLLTYFQGIRVAVLYGGAGIGGQIKQLERKPQIVVATPGRLMDHYNRKTIRLDKIQTVVLDEADRMLDMGFFKDVTRIIDKVKNRKNLGLFSATISQEVMTVSWMYQRDEVEITVEPKQEDRPDIDQFSITCTPLEKAETSLRLIRSQGYERVIDLLQHQAHVPASLRRIPAGGLGLRLHPRRYPPEPAGKDHAALSGRQAGRADRDGRGLPGHRRGRCGLRYQL